MNFASILGKQSKKPKVDPTLENLVKTETWCEYQSLGDWVTSGKRKKWQTTRIFF